jgi:beta-glucanase (GH16 family)
VSPGQRSGEFIQPFSLAIIAVVVAALAGVGVVWAAGSSKSSNGHAPTAASPASPTSPTPATTVPSGPQLPPPGSHLTFNATFTGTALDAATWATCYWYALPAAGCTHQSAYPEQEWYLPSQDLVSDGALHLTASPVSMEGTNAQGQPELFPCRSGMITTDASYQFTYGYVQVVAQLPKAKNTWPALWMLPANNAQVLPEIDLMELIGTQTTQALVTLHPAVGAQQNREVTTADLSSGWHTFGLNWKPGSLTWYIDGKAVFSTTSGVPDQPMYFLADLAITNAFNPLRLPSSCTGSLSIQSVQVWQSATP